MLAKRMLFQEDMTLFSSYHVFFSCAHTSFFHSIYPQKCAQEPPFSSCHLASIFYQAPFWEWSIKEKKGILWHLLPVSSLLLLHIYYLFFYLAPLYLDLVPLLSTGDNIIDTEEFEYVLSEFGISEKIARQAFTIFTEVRSFPSFSFHQEWFHKSIFTI